MSLFLKIIMPSMQGLKEAALRPGCQTARARGGDIGHMVLITGAPIKDVSSPKLTIRGNNMKIITSVSHMTNRGNARPMTDHQANEAVNREADEVVTIHAEAGVGEEAEVCHPPNVLPLRHYKGQ